MRYARIIDGVVINIVEASREVAESMGLVIIADLPISIDDHYDADTQEFSHTTVATLGAEGALAPILYYKKPPDNYEVLKDLYNKRVQDLIHARYSYDDENKILREYAFGESSSEFDAYNQYVKESKEQAHMEIFELGSIEVEDASSGELVML